jgi:putative membrane protein
MEPYLIAKALHVISFISWMAGMLYLPRLYVYHADVPVGSERDKMLQVMERKLLRYIVNPAMIATFAFGIWLIMILGMDVLKSSGWLHAKFTLLFLMTAVHGMLAGARKKFARGENTRSAKYYRWLNEAPTVLMIAIVFLAVMKPF